MLPEISLTTTPLTEKELKRVKRINKLVTSNRLLGRVLRWVMIRFRKSRMLCPRCFLFRRMKISTTNGRDSGFSFTKVDNTCTKCGFTVTVMAKFPTQESNPGIITINE